MGRRKWPIIIRLLKKFRKPSNSRLSAYIGTVGRELRWKSKSLRSKQNCNKIKVSFYVILSEREGSSHFGRERILRHCVPQNDI